LADLRDQLQARLSGSYTLGRELSGGGMSRVFVAEDSSLGRTVVIKMLAPELAAGLNAERFKREIMLAAQLHHAHIVPVLSAGVADDLPYFVMPFVVGEALRNRLIGETGLPLVETVNVLRDVAQALSFAHAQGVVHRDIKPDNVLLAGGSAVVTDFGIAKAISSAVLAAPGGTLTQVGTSLGTPAYMSPEQAAGDPDADARSDFYSFGVMAYEMITGRTPFHDRPTHALIMAHIAEPPEPVERLVPSVPSPLAHLVMRCLSKNPADRPQSAKEMLEDLDDIDLSGQRVRSGPQGTAGVRSGQTAGMKVDTSPHAYADGTMLVATPPLSGTAATAGSRRWIAGAAAVAAVALAGFLGRGFFKSEPVVPLDQHAMAVVPFRVASADPSHHYLREGMVDLIAAKLSGEELRAVEPRTVLDAWRQAGGSEARDLSREETIQLAQNLHAGKALLGDVVGTPDRLVLTVSLLSVPKGEQVSRVSVEGPPDSLASLVNQIATQLMTQTSGEGTARLSNLMSTSLPALRAYLDGQARLRRGDARNAGLDFARAVKEDSTFALAGLGLRLATAWYGDGQLGNRGLEIAFRQRARLSQRDQALLTALAGPRYPESSTNREMYTAREQYLQFSPDNAEAWYLMADQIFHAGAAMGISDWEQRSLAGFKRAMELDSLYLPGYTHAMPLAASMGDMDFLKRAERLRIRMDTAVFWRKQHDWYMAARAGDAAAAEKALESTGQLRDALLTGVIRHTQFDGTGASYALSAAEELVRTSATDALRRGRARFAHDVMLNLGRPADARRYLEMSRDSANDFNVPIIRVRAAIAGEGERNPDDAVRFLSAMEERPEPADSAGRQVLRAVVRVLEPWRLIHGDSSHTRRSLQRLRAIARTGPRAELANAQLEIAYIEMLHASLAKSPALRELTERADSMLMDQEFGSTHTGRTSQHALAIAHSWEKLGEPKRALSAALRYFTWNSEVMPYLGIQVREIARLAALAGDRPRAIRSYQHYLALRSQAEPSFKPQVDSVRAELARLQ
jgi:serine/threonine-protein kinase